MDKQTAEIVAQLTIDGHPDQAQEILAKGGGKSHLAAIKKALAPILEEAGLSKLTDGAAKMVDNMMKKAKPD